MAQKRARVSACAHLQLAPHVQVPRRRRDGAAASAAAAARTPTRPKHPLEQHGGAEGERRNAKHAIVSLASCCCRSHADVTRMAAHGAN